MTVTAWLQRAGVLTVCGSLLGKAVRAHPALGGVALLCSLSRCFLRGRAKETRCHFAIVFFQVSKLA